MHEIIIPEDELYDESSGTFITIRKQTIRLEHSLLSVSKWESKWHIPFFDVKPKTQQQLLDYIRCMTLTQNVPPEAYLGITREISSEVLAYCDDPMTATKIKDDPSKSKSRKIITSEQIYYWMFKYNIPIECEKWHINRLLTLIRVCNIEESPKKKMSANDTKAQYRALNRARRKK